MLVGYILALAGAEVVTSIVDPVAGILIHVAIFGLLLIHGATSRKSSIRAFVLSLSLAPMIRIVSLGMPLGVFPQIWWYALAATPLIVGCYLLIRTMSLKPQQIGLQLPDGWVHWAVTVVVALSGVILGFIEYHTLHPEALVTSLSLRDLILPMLILLVATGFMEELLFRGIMQDASRKIFGAWGGITSVSLVFAALHIGHLSMVNVGFVFLVSMYFGAVVYCTRTIAGVVIAHGLTNIFLYLILPNMDFTIGL